MSAPKRINLMPRVVKGPLTITRDKLLVWISIPLMSMVLLDFVSSSREYSAQTALLDEVKQNTLTLVRQMKALNIAPGEERQPAATAMDGVNEILHNKVVWTEPLRELSRIIPTGVWLSKLKASYDKSGMRSLVVSGSAGSEMMVSGFYARLENSYHLRNVAMSFTERQKDAVPLLYNFEFKVPLTKTGSKAAPAPETKAGSK